MIVKHRRTWMTITCAGNIKSINIFNLTHFVLVISMCDVNVKKKIKKEKENIDDVI